MYLKGYFTLLLINLHKHIYIHSFSFYDSKINILRFIYKVINVCDYKYSLNKL